MARQQKGRPGDLPFVHDFGEFSLYDAGDGKFKLCANGKVEGFANYTIFVEGGKFASRADRSRLSTTRPELYATLEKFFETGEAESLASDEDDPYGDIAMSRGRKATRMQDVRRLDLYRRQNRLGRRLGHTSAFMKVLEDYYGGKYAPRSCETLAAQFDLLEPEFEKTLTIDDLI